MRQMMIEGTQRSSWSGFRRWLRRGACGALGFLMLHAAAYAHPHIWVTYNLALQLSGKTLVAIQEKWVFGPEFPLASLVEPSEIPRSGAFSPKAMAVLRQQAFASLASDGYFTHGFAGTSPLKFLPPEKFTAEMEGGRLTYRFLVRLAGPVDLAKGNVTLGVWDDSFFVDATPAQGDAIVFDGTGGKACSASAFRDTVHSIYGGMVYPIAIRITC
jgi:ABC-type uncharacterized transport system substrate-binding protein